MPVNSGWYGDGAEMTKGWKERGRKDFWNPQEGDTLVYICPPCREDDRRNFYEVRVHYGIGAKNGMVVCLDKNENGILTNPNIARFLGDKDLGEACPACKALDAGEITDAERMEAMRPNWKYMWAVIPVAHRTSARDAWRPIEPQVVPMFCGQQIWDGICEVFANEGNITDFNRAIYVRINRKGTSKNSKYQVQGDSETMRRPIALPPEIQQMIATALAPGGSCDAYQLIGRITYPFKKALALLRGIEVDDVDEDEDKNEEKGDQRVDFKAGQNPMFPQSAATGPVGTLPATPRVQATAPVSAPAPAPAPAAPVAPTVPAGVKLGPAVEAKAAEVGGIYNVQGKTLAFEGVNADGIPMFIDAEGKPYRVHPLAKIYPEVIEPDPEPTSQVVEEPMLGAPAEEPMLGAPAEEPMLGAPAPAEVAPATVAAPSPAANESPALQKLRAQLAQKKAAS